MYDVFRLWVFFIPALVIWKYSYLGEMMVLGRLILKLLSLVKTLYCFLDSTSWCFINLEAGFLYINYYVVLVLNIKEAVDY